MEENLCLCSDQHGEKDCLGFDQYIDVIGSMMRDEQFQTPFCVGVFGKWGSGKTTFMRLLMNSILCEPSSSSSSSSLKIVPVWFNPWRYDREEHLIIPFLKTIEHGMNEAVTATGSDVVKTAIKEAAGKIRRVAAAFAYGMDMKVKLGPMAEFKFDVAKATKREEELEKREKEDAASVAENFSSLYYDSMTQLKQAVNEKQFRMVVFIDDLDRCLPEKVVELLESIKLFFDIKGYLFVMGLDKQVVKKGIAHRYRHFEADSAKKGVGSGDVISPEDYLEKMIQLPIELPPVEPGKKRKYIESLLSGQKAYMDHARLIEVGVGENPRSLKRFVNLLAFTGRLADRVKAGILEGYQNGDENNVGKDNGNGAHQDLLNRYFIPEFYIKWTIIVFRFHEVYRRIKGNRDFLFEIQEVARNGSREDEPDLESDSALQTEHAMDAESALKSGKSLNLEKPLKDVLLYGKPFPNERWLIDHFVHLAQVTDMSAQGENARSGYREDLKPGDMVRIPRGLFKYGHDKEDRLIDYDYYIDAFPVTNGQYQRFIDDRTDYGVPGYWDKETRKYPEGLGDHPVVKVSHNDAVAYCQWRSEIEGGEYRLPTEEEWEKAARGEDGRNYPWGEEFDSEKCNSKESGIKGTTPVTQYPEGRSPYGLYDMAGNVSEWTDSWHDKSNKYRVLRAGAWFGGSDFCLCGHRSGGRPFGRNFNVGFRCGRT